MMSLAAANPHDVTSTESAEFADECRAPRARFYRDVYDPEDSGRQAADAGWSSLP
jgi:hypothetical protein